MVSGSKIKALDFYRKIPRDLTEASFSGAGLSIIAAVCMIFLFGMELNNYLSVSTTTIVIVDGSQDGENLRIDFNISFLALPCEFASVDVSDVLGTNRLNITKTVRKYSISPDMKVTGPKFHPGPIPSLSNHEDHDDGNSENLGDGSVELNEKNFDLYTHEYRIFVVKFFAPWCYWSKRMKPSWEKAAKIMRERYDPEMDRRILLGNVDCTAEIDLCKRHQIQGYPSIRIFRKQNDVRDDHGHHEHESYYGDRDTDSLVAAMEALVASIPVESKTGACRIEGSVRVKKVPGNLIISAVSGSHSFDAATVNMSHIITQFSFGKKLSVKLLKKASRLSPYVGASVDWLSGKSHIATRENVTVDHYLQVVKTELVSNRIDKNNVFLEEYEYTAHSSMMQTAAVPAAKFHFELSPMQVLVTKNKKSFSHLITNVCAIIGGVFTSGQVPPVVPVRQAPVAQRGSDDAATIARLRQEKAQLRTQVVVLQAQLANKDRALDLAQRDVAAAQRNVAAQRNRVSYYQATYFAFVPDATARVPPYSHAAAQPQGAIRAPTRSDTPPSTPLTHDAGSQA